MDPASSNCFLCVITPIVYKITKSVNYSFKHPLIIMVILCGLFASQMTPSLYAISDIGAGRQIDIYYYAYYILLIVLDFYLCGWLNNKIPNILNDQLLNKFADKYLFRIFVFAVVIWGIGCFGHHISNMTSIQTAQAIVNGSVKSYDSQADALANELEEGSGDLFVSDVKTIPPFLTGFHLSGENEEFFNDKMAYYFGVESIKFME